MKEECDILEDEIINKMRAHLLEGAGGGICTPGTRARARLV